jgi:hypothetical protein
MMKSLAGVVGLSIICVAGCATYETTLTNAQGQTTACKASGKSGIVTGYYLRKGFEDCVNQAKAAGYSETPQRSSSLRPN